VDDRLAGTLGSDQANLVHVLADALSVDPADMTLVRRLLSRHSEVLWFATRGDHRRVVVKRIARSRSFMMALKTISAEFFNLKAVSHLGLSNGSYPKPIAIFPSFLAMAVGPVDGRPLTRMLRDDAHALSFFRTATLPALRGAARSAGVWLSELQGRSGPKSLPFDSEPVLQELTRNREQLTDLSAAERLLDATVATVKRLHGQPMQHAARHGDFTPQNVLVTPQGSVGIVDFENFALSTPTYFDPATFVAYVEVARRSVVYSTNRLDHFLAAFWDGYGSKPAGQAWIAFLSLALTRVLAGQPRRGWRHFIRDVAEGRRLARFCERLGKDL
jgi:hypothetical protein